MWHCLLDMSINGYSCLFVLEFSLNIRAELKPIFCYLTKKTKNSFWAFSRFVLSDDRAKCESKNRMFCPKKYHKSKLVPTLYKNVQAIVFFIASNPFPANSVIMTPQTNLPASENLSAHTFPKIMILCTGIDWMLHDITSNSKKTTFFYLLGRKKVFFPSQSNKFYNPQTNLELIPSFCAEAPPFVGLQGNLLWISVEADKGICRLRKISQWFLRGGKLFYKSVPTWTQFTSKN